MGDCRQAGRCYARGFHATHQLRNDSELLYTNLCHAQLAALAYWLRAVLHWLSNPWPEALAPRVAQAVLGRPLSNRAAEVEPISQALSTQLRGACLRLGIDPAPAARPVPLHRIGPASRPDACVGQPGWSVRTSAADHGPMPFDGPAAMRHFIGWHLVVLHGLDADGNVWVADPLHGPSICPYRAFACAYRAHYAWTHSYRHRAGAPLRPRPSPAPAPATADRTASSAPPHPASC